MKVIGIYMLFFLITVFQDSLRFFLYPIKIKIVFVSDV
jgi:hypothetical protein